MPSAVAERMHAYEQACDGDDTRATHLAAEDIDFGLRRTGQCQEETKLGERGSSEEDRGEHDGKGSCFHSQVLQQLRVDRYREQTPLSTH